MSLNIHGYGEDVRRVQGKEKLVFLEQWHSSPLTFVLGQFFSSPDLPAQGPWVERDGQVPPWWCQKTSRCNSPARGCFPGRFASEAALIFETKIFHYFHRKPRNKQFLISKMYPLPADALYSETAFSIK